MSVSVRETATAIRDSVRDRRPRQRSGAAAVFSGDCPRLRSLITVAAICPDTGCCACPGRCRRQVHPRIRVPHGGARHRRRCCDFVLRFDFDGAWHRPTGSLRFTDFDAPIFQPRSPRLPPLTLLGPQRGGFLNALNPNNVKDGTPGQRALPATGRAGGKVQRLTCNSHQRHARLSRPPRSGWAGGFVLRSGTVTGSGTGRDRLHHWRIAYGSAKEVDCHLRLLVHAGAIDSTRASASLQLFDQVRAMTWRLLNAKS